MLWEALKLSYQLREKLDFFFLFQIYGFFHHFLLCVVIETIIQGKQMKFANYISVIVILVELFYFHL